ncbi:MFS transporter [Conexibacter sp. JD483]|uniref:MFS transporter n=1 Tax=unclassified Conexibacter TaxID=2627773 RepID=UPI002718557F|nr:MULTISPECIES: MFS transporter [unclassified Conexibacter]MDO8188613.1 MFS transporter [Conexibacter sp. CPCC 205706]MDO8201503.1 MFS transporter [Conexibacter sp. CPCC 205762]MDR9370870.1 MFS transporter [Conexibacter sp. JD483]
MTETTQTLDGDAVAPAPTTPAWEPQQIAALAVIAVVGVIVALTQTLLVPVMGAIQADLGSSTAGTQWLLTSTLLSAAVAVPVFGRLGDLYGKRLMLMVATGALAVGSLVCALTSDLTVMIAGRAITGMSAAAIPLGISLIGQILPRERAGGGIALVSATLGVGGALGLPLAALVAEHADYHVLFWICAAGGALAVAGMLFFVSEPAGRAQGRLDLVGSVLLGATLIALLLPLSQAKAWGWGDPRTLGLLAAAVVGLVVFVLVEKRIASPLIDVVANARPALLLTNVASICVGFALFASLIGTASFVQAPPEAGYGFGSSVLEGGLAMLPSGVMMLLLSPVSAKLSARFGPKVTLALGASIVALGFVVRIVLVDAYWQVLVGTTIAGAGTGIAYAAMPSLILLGAKQSQLAAANGLNALCRTTGSSLASAAGGTLLASMTVTLAGSELPSLAGYRTLFAICAGAALVGALVALVIPAATERELG